MFPLKSVTDKQITDALNKLSTVGIAELYTVDGKPFLQLRTWENHQRIRAQKSKYPPPDNTCCQLTADDGKCSRNPIQSESNPNPNPNPTALPAPHDAVSSLFAEYAGEDEALLSALKDFRAMRKQIKKPLSERAAQMVVASLKKLSETGNPPVQVLEQSILHCWQGVFALKGGGISGRAVKDDGDSRQSGEYGNYL